MQRIASHLLEDWADEWFGRYAISSRWCYPHNVDHVAKGFYANRIGKFMNEGLSPEEEEMAASVIIEVRDNFGLKLVRIVAAGRTKRMRYVPISKRS